LETSALSMSCASSCHSVPSLGLRFETRGGRALVYSSDTSPCPAIAELAQNADVLIHESTFQDGEEEQALQLKHSSAGQAAEVGTQAGARRLVLIHYTPQV